jgi:hypothetical protein
MRRALRGHHCTTVIGCLGVGEPSNDAAAPDDALFSIDATDVDFEA